MTTSLSTAWRHGLQMNDNVLAIGSTNLSDDELPSALVKNTIQFLVQDHLRQFLLHPLEWKLDQVRQMLDLDAGTSTTKYSRISVHIQLKLTSREGNAFHVPRIRLDEAKQVFFQQGLFQVLQVGSDKIVVHKLRRVVDKRSLELVQRPVLVGLHSHAKDFRNRVPITRHRGTLLWTRTNN